MKTKTERNKKPISVLLTDEEAARCGECAKRASEETGYTVTRAAWLRKVVLEAVEAVEAASRG